MLDTFMNSAKLLFAGKLFRDNGAVFVQWLKGFAICVALMLLLGWFVSPLIGIVVTAVVGGFIQPLLFKDLKYA